MFLRLYYSLGSWYDLVEIKVFIQNNVCITEDYIEILYRTLNNISNNCTYRAH